MADCIIALNPHSYIFLGLGLKKILTLKKKTLTLQKGILYTINNIHENKSFMLLK